MQQARGIASSTAVCAATATAMAAAVAIGGRETGLADDARALLRFDFGGVRRSPVTVAEIGLENARIAAGALVCAALVPRVGARGRRAMSVLLTVLLVLNAAVIGVGIGAYGGRLLAAIR